MRFNRKIYAPPVKVPYYSNADEEAGIIYLSPLRHIGQHSASGPLQERAWAFQEQELSRRMLHCTGKGLRWGWRVELHEERFHHKNRWSNKGWDALVNEYSVRQLIKHTDRLIALQGLANELQEKRTDRYRLGIWTADLPKHLLWQPFNQGHISEDLPNTPSWTWPKTASPKKYPFSGLNGLNILEEISVDGSGRLDVRGPLAPCRLSEHSLMRCCIRAMGDLSDFYFEYLIADSSNASRFTILWTLPIPIRTLLV